MTPYRFASVTHVSHTRHTPGSDRHVYLINVIADQPLSENNTAQW